MSQPKIIFCLCALFLAGLLPACKSNFVNQNFSAAAPAVENPKLAEIKSEPIRKIL